MHVLFFLWGGRAQRQWNNSELKDWNQWFRNSASSCFAIEREKHCPLTKITLVLLSEALTVLCCLKKNYKICLGSWFIYLFISPLEHQKLLCELQCLCVVCLSVCVVLPIPTRIVRLDSGMIILVEKWNISSEAINTTLVDEVAVYPWLMWFMLNLILPAYFLQHSKLELLVGPETLVLWIYCFLKEQNVTVFFEVCACNGWETYYK